MKNKAKELLAIPPEDWLEEAERRERAGDKQGAKTARQFARFLMGQKDAFENPRGVYTTYSAWRAAAKKAGAVRFEGDKDIAQAFDATGFGVAEWDGAEGYIYRKSEMRNPMQRPNDEDPLDAIYVEYMRPMQDEEPFMMGDSKYQFVRARYPDGRMDIAVYSQRGDVTYGYRHWRQMMGIEKSNPVHSRNPKQRIAVCLSKSRKRNPVYDTGSDE